MEVKIKRCYRHKKGGIYIVVGIGVHTETGEQLVSYQPLRDTKVWYFRPYSQFTDGRFTLIPWDQVASSPAGMG